jgi:hypothetical protein
VSRYTAERFAHFDRIADLACGIGGDLVQLARHSRVLAVDSDPVRLRMAAANTEVYGVLENCEFLLADLSQLETPDVQAIWFDPARRTDGRRRVSMRDYSPPVLEMLDRWRPTVRAVGIKVAPAVPYEEFPEDCEVEFISDNRELKEAVLWFGQLKTAERKATALPSTASLVLKAVSPTPVSAPGAYLYEPDPAVIRGHLIEQLAEEIGAWRTGEEIAYLSSDDLAETPLARAYHVLEVLPFSL